MKIVNKFLLSLLMAPLYLELLILALMVLLTTLSLPQIGHTVISFLLTKT